MSSKLSVIYLSSCLFVVFNLSEYKDHSLVMMIASARPLLTSTPPKAMRLSASHNNNKKKNNKRGKGKGWKKRRTFRTRNKNVLPVVVVRAKQNDKDDDENERRMAKLAKLEKVFLIVFNSGAANEALYTTSSREFDVPRNDFLCFASMRDALRASVLISEQTDLMPVVEGVSADVVLFLCSRSGFGAEVIGEGERWTPPGVVIEDDDALIEDVSSDSRSDSSSSGEEELAISSADLEKYLADGGSFREEIREQFYDNDDDDDDDSVEEEQKKMKEVIANSDLDDARRIAAYAVQSAAAKPIKALSNAFERTAQLSTLKSILRRNANKVSATTNGALMNALQNVARKRMMTKPKKDDF